MRCQCLGPSLFLCLPLLRHVFNHRSHGFESRPTKIARERLSQPMPMTGKMSEREREREGVRARYVYIYLLVLLQLGYAANASNCQLLQHVPKIYSLGCGSASTERGHLGKGVKAEA